MFLEVWQAKELRARFSDVWQIQALVKKGTASRWKNGTEWNGMTREVPTPWSLQKSAEEVDSRWFVAEHCATKSAKSAEEAENKGVAEEAKSNAETPRAQRRR